METIFCYDEHNLKKCIKKKDFLDDKMYFKSNFKISYCMKPGSLPVQPTDALTFQKHRKMKQFLCSFPISGDFETLLGATSKCKH